MPSRNPASVGARLRRWAVNGLLIAMTTILALLLTETALRVTRLARIPPEAHSPYPRYYYVADSVSGFDIARNVPAQSFTFTDYYTRYHQFFPVWSNELGCFDRPVEPVLHSVLLLGDSFTWGYTPFDSTWGSRLERELGVRVIKCGVGGYGTRQTILKFQRLLPEIPPPAVVVLGYYIGNDLMDDYLFPQTTVQHGYLASQITLGNPETGQRQTRSAAEISAAEQATLEQPRGIQRFKKWVTRHSIVYNLLRENREIRGVMASMGLADPSPPNAAPPQFRDPSRTPWLDSAWTAHLDNLRSIDHEVKQSGSRLLIVVFPTKEQVYEFLRPSGLGAVDWGLANRKLGAFFESSGIEFVDLLPEFRQRVSQRPRRRLDPDRDLYWMTDAHLNLLGDHLAGLLIGRYLLSHRLVPSDSGAERLRALEAELARLKVR